MNSKLYKFILSALLTVNFATFSITARSADDLEDVGKIQLEIKDGLLSLQTDTAALDKVIRQIGEYAGFRTILADDFDQSSLVSASLENISVEQAVERLVNDENRIILYAKSSNETEKQIISQVWLLGTGDPSMASMLNESQAISPLQGNTLSEENIKDHKLNKLTKILREDQQARIRVMAASALGALQSKNAISALQAGLLDKDSLVRSEVISSLARVGGQQAVTVLGNLLLNTSVNIAERIKAAQALWQEGSESAKGYLNAGKLDETHSVRLASSEPPISSKSDTFTTLASDTQAQ